jgi:hypothetical protein
MAPPWQPASQRAPPWQPTSQRAPPWQPIPADVDDDKTFTMDKTECENTHNGNNKRRKTDHNIKTSSSDKAKLPASAQHSTKNNQNSKEIIVKDFKSSGSLPKFVPRQITKKDIPGLNKEAFRQSIKDAVNESLRKNAFILDDMKGPSLPAEVEERRQKFRESNTGDKSIDKSSAGIRSKVRQVREHVFISTCGTNVNQLTLGRGGQSPCNISIAALRPNTQKKHHYILGAHSRYMP